MNRAGCLTIAALALLSWAIVVVCAAMLGVWLGFWRVVGTP